MSKKKQAAKKAAATKVPSNVHSAIQVLSQPALLEKCKEILKDYVSATYPSASTLEEVMDNYKTEESCAELINSFTEAQKEYFLNPNNYLYDVMHTNNLRGFIELCIRDMYKVPVLQGE